MARTSCLAGVRPDRVARLKSVLKAAGMPTKAVVANLDIAALRTLGPDIIVCDIDGLLVDPLEQLRQLRFVLPGCIIVVYTFTLSRSWSLACHLAGANGILAKASNAGQLTLGIRAAMRNGCFTDPRCAVA